MLIVVAMLAAVVVAYLVKRPTPTQLLAFYSSGRATVALDDGAPTAFALVDRGALLVSPGGAGLTWKSAEGWYLNVNGPFNFTSGARAAGEVAVPLESIPIDSKGTLQIEGVDGRRWVGFDSGACRIEYTEVAVTRIAGSIHCLGAAWYDASSVERIRLLDLPPFDLAVTFEVTGDGTFPTPTPS